MEEHATLIMTTVATQADAESIAARLLEQGLAACVQEMPVTSRYRWQGEVQRGVEILLLVKTVASAADEAMRAIEALHAYDVPEILALPVTGGLPAYLQWLAAETRREA